MVVPSFLGSNYVPVIAIEPLHLPGSFIKDPPKLQKLYLPFKYEDILTFGGETVVVCKGTGYNFTFWCHVAGDYLIVT